MTDQHYDFTGKTVIVTGAGSGLGRGMALAFGEAGAKVVVAEINAASGRSTVKQITDAGGQALFVKVDVSNEDSVENMVTVALESCKSIHFAINNAAITGNGMSLHETDAQSWCGVMNVNVNGVFYCMKHEIAAMLGNGGGCIVNISSLAGLRGFGFRSDYVTSKHAVNGLTQCAAIQYAEQGIRINALAPGSTESIMELKQSAMPNPTALAMANSMRDTVPMKRAGKISEIADVALWLCSGQSSYVTGQCLGVDGGLGA